jgi:hypothetical protein
MAQTNVVTETALPLVEMFDPASGRPHLESLAAHDPGTTSAKVVELVRRDGGVVITGLIDKAHTLRIRKELKPVFEADVPDKSGFFPSTTRRATGLLGVSDGCVELATNKLWIDVANEILTSICRPWYGEKRAHFVSKPILAGTFGFQISPGSRQQELHRDDRCAIFVQFIMQCSTKTGKFLEWWLTYLYLIAIIIFRKALIPVC